MAAAETDRDAPSALCSEFLNFSAKDTAAVGDSFIKTLWNVSSDELYVFVCCNRCVGDEFQFFSLLDSGCFAQCRPANPLTASLWDLHTSSSKTHTHLTLRLREYLFNIAASKTFCRFSRFGFHLWLCWQFKEICQELDKNNWLLCSSFLRHHVVYGVISIASNSSFNSVTIDLGKQTVKQSLGICVVFPRSCKNTFFI